MHHSQIKGPFKYTVIIYRLLLCDKGVGKAGSYMLRFWASGGYRG